MSSKHVRNTECARSGKLQAQTQSSRKSRCVSAALQAVVVTLTATELILTASEHYIQSVDAHDTVHRLGNRSILGQSNNNGDGSDYSCVSSCNGGLYHGAETSCEDGVMSEVCFAGDICPPILVWVNATFWKSDPIALMQEGWLDILRLFCSLRSQSTMILFPVLLLAANIVALGLKCNTGSALQLIVSGVLLSASPFLQTVIPWIPFLQTLIPWTPFLQTVTSWTTWNRDTQLYFYLHVLVATSVIRVLVWLAFPAYTPQPVEVQSPLRPTTQPDYHMTCAATEQSIATLEDGLKQLRINDCRHSQNERASWLKTVQHLELLPTEGKHPRGSGNTYCHLSPQSGGLSSPFMPASALPSPSTSTPTLFSQPVGLSWQSMSPVGLSSQAALPGSLSSPSTMPGGLPLQSMSYNGPSLQSVSPVGLSSQCLSPSGLSLQPTSYSGLPLQPTGVPCNGLSLQPVLCNGLSLQPMSCNGLSLQPMSCNGLSSQLMSYNGLSMPPDGLLLHSHSCPSLRFASPESLSRQSASPGHAFMSSNGVSLSKSRPSGQSVVPGGNSCMGRRHHITSASPVMFTNSTVCSPPVKTPQTAGGSFSETSLWARKEGDSNGRLTPSRRGWRTHMFRRDSSSPVRPSQLDEHRYSQISSATASLSLSD